jgi:hypothetical protein
MRASFLDRTSAKRPVLRRQCLLPDADSISLTGRPAPRLTSKG